MSCKLHIPWIYDALRDEISCQCGYVVITRRESYLENRWRAMFPHEPALMQPDPPSPSTGAV